MQIGLILLAAGSSSRMGFPKQNIIIKGKTMLQYLADMVLHSDFAPITVVVGANKNQVVPQLEGMPLTIIDNPQHATGMAGSIKMGLVGTYMSDKNIEAVIIMTSDMPFVDLQHLDKLKDSLLDGVDIVASAYGGSVGIPAIFRRNVFEELLHLEGDKGAKEIIKKGKTVMIEIGEKGVDIDTFEDLEAVRKKYPNLF